MDGKITNEQVVQKLAGKYHKTPAQIALRWDLQHEVVTIPKSTHSNRIAENGQILTLFFHGRHECVGCAG